MGPGQDTHFIDFNSSEFVFVSKNLVKKNQEWKTNLIFLGAILLFFLLFHFVVLAKVLVDG